VNTATFLFVGPSTTGTVSSGVSSVNPSGRLTVNGQGGGTFVNAYNSTSGDYASSRTNDSRIESGGGVELTSGAELRGNVEADGDLVLSGNSVVTGNASISGSVTLHGGGSEVRGEIRDGPQPTQHPIADGLIASKRAAFADENNNDDDSRIIDGEITDSNVLTGSNPTVLPGTYYLSSFALSNEQVTFDVGTGDVKVFVDDDVSLDRADVNVVNTSGNAHSVRMYAQADEFSFERANIDVAGDVAPAFWLYGPSGVYVELKRSSVTGVVYAPGTQTSPGQVDIATHSALFGGIVGGDTEVGSQSSIHYDTALRTQQVVNPPDADDLYRFVQYFHISYSEVELT